MSRSVTIGSGQIAGNVALLFNNAEQLLLLLCGNWQRLFNSCFAIASSKVMIMQVEMLPI